jgi:hypothetical protein
MIAEHPPFSLLKFPKPKRERVPSITAQRAGSSHPGDKLQRLAFQDPENLRLVEHFMDGLLADSDDVKGGA